MSSDFQTARFIRFSLRRPHPQKAELVKLRYVAGLTLPQAAEVLGISTPTAERHWALARVWLFREISRRRGKAD